MTDTLGVASVYDDLVARFAAEAAVKSVLDLDGWTTSTSTPSIAGTPTADADVVVRFPVGGTVGTTGIKYQTSTDGGTTWGTLTALGLATTILLLGVTLTLGAGDVTAHDAVAWVQQGPAPVTEFAFGWREPSHRSGNLRILFVPGIDGDLGELVAPRMTGHNPRAAADLVEGFTVYIEARDVTTPTDERKQYTAARLLFDRTWSYLRDIATANLELRSARWRGVGGTLGAQSQSGAVLVCSCSLRVPVWTEPRMTAPTTTDAIVETTAVVEDGPADQTDTDTVSRSDTP